VRLAESPGIGSAAACSIAVACGCRKRCAQPRPDINLVAAGRESAGDAAGFDAVTPLELQYDAVRGPPARAARCLSPEVLESGPDSGARVRPLAQLSQHVV